MHTTPIHSTRLQTFMPKDKASRFEFWFLVVALLGFSKPLFWLFDEATLQDRGVLAPLTSSTALWLFAGSIFTIAALFSRKQLLTYRDVMLSIWPLLAIVGVAACSIVWSIDPMLTARRVMGLLLTTLFGIYCGVRVSRLQLMWAAGIAMMLGLLLSVLAIFLFPHEGIMLKPSNLEYAWRGVYPHKSPASRVAGLAAIVCWMGLLINSPAQYHQKWLWPALLVSLVLLTLTSVRSTTAVVIGTMVGVYVLWFWTAEKEEQQHSWWARHDSMLGMALALVVIVLVLMTLIEPERFISPLLLNAPSDTQSNAPTDQHTSGSIAGLQREPLVATTIVDEVQTLNGRTDLWTTLWQFGCERPILGYGHDTFWHGDNQRNYNQLPQRNWASTAHNGLFEVFLNLGLVGIITVIGGHLWVFYKIARDFKGHPTFIWTVGFFLYLIGVNLLDANLLGRYDIFWILTVAITAQYIPMPHQKSTSYTA